MTSDVTDFGGLDAADHARTVLVYDDTLTAYELASGLISMIDVYPSRAAFPGQEALDPWV